jgi:H+-translocating NAD(P) transhydrogenase subunit alpha
VVVTTAAVPGRPAPRIVARPWSAAMKPGSVMVDLAAESGGNCELTRPGERVDSNGVTIIDGPTGLASMGSLHASEMYARNLLQLRFADLAGGAFALDWDDDLVAGSLPDARRADPPRADP